jgi:hypothetical protein
MMLEKDLKDFARSLSGAGGYQKIPRHNLFRGAVYKSEELFNGSSVA